MQGEMKKADKQERIESSLASLEMATDRLISFVDKVEHNIMKCQVCKLKECESNSIVCSDNCNSIRLMIIRLTGKYTPTNGCENCHGDLGGQCSEQCRKEFDESRRFVSELYNLVRMSINSA